jgi:hypothetical protein
MAAVLACGDGALLSHESAAVLHGLLTDGRLRIDVTSALGSGRRKSGIRAHESRILLPRDMVRVENIPCTSIPRTLLDVAANAGAHKTDRCCERAVELRVFDLTAIQDVMSRANGHPGLGVLRTVLADGRHFIGETPTRNEMEARMLAICLDAGLPRPSANRVLDLDDGRPPVIADFAWMEEKVIAETDGVETHGTRRGRERDNRRDRRLMLAGWRVAHYSWWEVMNEPERIVQELREMLESRSEALAA